MVGFASALLGELATGKGPLGQLQIELGVPPIGADIIVFGSIAYRSAITTITTLDGVNLKYSVVRSYFHRRRRWVSLVVQYFIDRIVCSCFCCFQSSTQGSTIFDSNLNCSLIGALRPGSPTFSESNQRDVKKRGKGPTQNPKINVAEDPKKFLGVTRFGFSKQNEVSFLEHTLSRLLLLNLRSLTRFSKASSMLWRIC